jgi:hypothetical protein
MKPIKLMTDQERELFKEKLEKRREQNKKSARKPKTERRTYGEGGLSLVERVEITRNRIL